MTASAKPTMRTAVYVDGFNLYYRAVKGTPYKWLDIKALAAGLLRPENEITCIRYFTADVSGKRDPFLDARCHLPSPHHRRALGRGPVPRSHPGHEHPETGHLLMVAVARAFGSA